MLIGQIICESNVSLTDIANDDDFLVLYVQIYRSYLSITMLCLVSFISWSI